ncbi:hypothetical protein V2J09_020463 [Rumex salicifolius]
MASFATTDLGDGNEALLETGDLRALQPIFNSYGLKKSFHGRIVTLKVFEDNVLVRKMLESSPEYGPGSILVVDGGGSVRCALVGGNLGQLAYTSGWGGIVVNGCIRDVDEINACDIGVRALATHPLKSKKRGAGEARLPVYVGGTLIKDGEYLYADGDGILVSKNPLDMA